MNLPESLKAFCLDNGVKLLEKPIPIVCRGHAAVQGFFCGVKDERIAISIEYRLFLITKDHATYLIPNFIQTGNSFLHL